MKKGRILAVLLAMVIVGALLVISAPRSRAAFTSLNLEPGMYTDTNVYVPGETIKFTIVADAGDTYDVAFVYTPTSLIIKQWDNVQVGTDGEVSLTYTIGSLLDDSTEYRIEVWDSNYDFGSGTCTNPGACRFGTRWLTVQEYSLNVFLDRSWYLVGDKVIITWSANYLKNNSVVVNGKAEISVVDRTDAALATNPYSSNEGAGVYTVTLPMTTTLGQNHRVEAWFNGTATTPKRSQAKVVNFNVGYLGVIATASAQYAPGSIVSLQVSTKVMDSLRAPRQNDPNEPGVKVDISVKDTTSGNIVPDYGASGLVTDAKGQLTWVFQLQSGIADGTVFEVTVNATANGVISTETKVSFTVKTAAVLSASIEFDKSMYASGDSVTVTVNAISSAGAVNFTYIYEIRDGGSGGGLFTYQTSKENKFTYTTPASYEGILWVQVKVDDGMGNVVAQAGIVQVRFGWVLVNLDRYEYDAGNTVTVTYSIVSTQITSPTYFYEIRDATGNVVLSAQVTETKFTYVIPATPSTQYTFTVTASENGRTISGSATAQRIQGYFLSFTLDRTSYALGETIKVHYKIEARGSTPLPKVFTLVYGLVNAASYSYATDKAEGDLSYVVPSGVNEGDQLFSIWETGTGSHVSETVTIRATNPLWFTTLADIPVFDIFLLILIVILFVLLFRGGLRGLGVPAKPKEAKPEVPKEAEKPAPPPAGPMTVNCKACGASIEITTSKRPIEVMCPSCGETQMVQ